MAVDRGYERHIDAMRSAEAVSVSMNDGGNVIDIAITRDSLEGMAVKAIIESNRRWHQERQVMTHPTVQGLMEKGVIFPGVMEGEGIVNGMEMKAGEPINARAFTPEFRRGEPVMVTPLKPVTREDRIQESLQTISTTKGS